MYRLAVLSFGLTFVLLAPVRAELVASDIRTVEASPSPGAVLPSGVLLRDENDVVRPLPQWLDGKPSVWVLADLTCDTLCGPVVSTVSDALRQSGLRPGADFIFNVLSFNPQNSADDAGNLRQAQVGTGALGNNTRVLRALPADIPALTKAFGFEAVYDRDRRRYAHPAAAFVVAPDGRIARALPGLGLDPANLRLALVDAGRGRIGGWTEHVRLMCYGFDPASGLYTLAVGRLLWATAVVTMLGLGLLMWALVRRERVAARG